MRLSLQRLLPAFSALVLGAGLFIASPARAAEVKTAFGSFNAPDGVAVVNREEKPDKAGKPTGMAGLSVGGGGRRAQRGAQQAAVRQRRLRPRLCRPGL